MPTVSWNFTRILSSFFFALSAFGREEAYFSPGTDLESVVIREMALAEKSLDVAIYTFSSKDIRSVLLDKLGAGKKVRLVVEKVTSPGVLAFVTPLLEAGASVRYVTEINHHKFAIIDGQTLLSSSGNFNSADLAKTYDENLLVCTDCSERRAAYQKEFDALFQLSNPARETDPNFLVGSNTGPVNVAYPGVALFTSANYIPRQANADAKITFKVNVDYPGTVAGALKSAIDAAQSQILVASGHFRSKPLYDALKNAAARGVKVRLVLDGQEYLSKRAASDQDAEIRQCLTTQSEEECYREGVRFSRMLDAAGLDVRMKYYSFRWFFPYAPQMHHKYMIIDGQTLYTGSYNWSNNAEFNTFENVTITENTAIVASYLQNFEELTAHGGVDAFANLLTKLQTAADKIPVKFAPVAVKVGEVDQLLETARQRCPNLYLLPASAQECEI